MDLIDPLVVKCIVKGCKNHSDGGAFHGEICEPCRHMLMSGMVHPKNPTFIGDLSRLVWASRTQMTITTYQHVAGKDVKP